MKQPSSNSEGLLGSLFSSPAVDAELSDDALLRAMLDAEAALALASAEAGLVPTEAAGEIEQVCRRGDFELAQLGVQAEAAGNPAAPLSRAIVERVSAAAKPWVHHGATSQDILDTALMLLAQRAGRAIVVGAAATVASCAELAEQHRHTVMLARTLGQPAVVTTFGLKAAGWLVALDSAGARLALVLEQRIAVQLGGSAGTLGVFGAAGPEVLRRIAARLGLAEPAMPWHTDRQRVLDLAAALGALIAATGKVALDVELLAQAEVGEVSEGGAGHGTSSAMPHKRNPIDAALVRSASYRAPGLVATLYGASQHENERAAGAWHAEWQPLRELLSVAGGALSRTARMLENLDVHVERMFEDVDATRGLVMAEQLASRLAPLVGRVVALDTVARCCDNAVSSGRPLRDVALADDVVRTHLSAVEIADALDPEHALEAVPALIDRALASRKLLVTSAKFA
jgi:3-carboxy-cis,cis-muconate cycloisomerase